MNQIITINGEQIHQDKRGYFCLNDFHKAAGAHPKHRPSYFLELQQTVDMIAALKCRNHGILENVYIIRGRNGGTYVCKELVYAYAMWISAEFHITVIQTFDALVMESMEWQQARTLGKATRRTLTDTIQRLIPYAIAQGSQHLDKYYMSYTKMVYGALELIKSNDDSFRDTLSTLQHSQLAVMEHAARQTIEEGMTEGLYYKDIFQKAKQDCLALATPLLKYTGREFQDILAA